MTTATDKDFVHPADALALALDRAAGLLSVLSDLYNPSHDSFASGNAFVMHGMSTASTLLSDARAALLDLHEGCDLVLRDTDSEAETDASPQVAESIVNFTRATQEPAWTDTASSEPAAPQADYRPAAAAVSEQDHFAKSYLELLKKLTAAEVFASEQQALSVPGSGTDLLPLLRGLREDFQKMHNVG
jgi:hypothetical protein